jgi:hypothetical protein
MSALNLSGADKEALQDELWSALQLGPATADEALCRLPEKRQAQLSASGHKEALQLVTRALNDLCKVTQVYGEGKGKERSWSTTKAAPEKVKAPKPAAGNQPPRKTSCPIRAAVLAALTQAGQTAREVLANTSFYVDPRLARECLAAVVETLGDLVREGLASVTGRGEGRRWQLTAPQAAPDVAEVAPEVAEVASAGEGAADERPWFERAPKTLALLCRPCFEISEHALDGPCTDHGAHYRAQCGHSNVVFGSSHQEDVAEAPAALAQLAAAREILRRAHDSQDAGGLYAGLMPRWPMRVEKTCCDGDALIPHLRVVVHVPARKLGRICDYVAYYCCGRCWHPSGPPQRGDTSLWTEREVSAALDRWRQDNLGHSCSPESLARDLAGVQDLTTAYGGSLAQASTADAPAHTPGWSEWVAAEVQRACSGCGEVTTHTHSHVEFNSLGTPLYVCVGCGAGSWPTHCTQEAWGAWARGEEEHTITRAALERETRRLEELDRATRPKRAPAPVPEPTPNADTRTLAIEGAWEPILVQDSRFEQVFVREGSMEIWRDLAPQAPTPPVPEPPPVQAPALLPGEAAAAQVWEHRRTLRQARRAAEKAAGRAEPLNDRELAAQEVFLFKALLRAPLVRPGACVETVLAELTEAGFVTTEGEGVWKAKEGITWERFKQWSKGSPMMEVKA